MTADFDCIVIGAGVEGSATAYQLSRRGKRVLLLDQFSLPHTRGSSHGTTRITRKMYPEAEFYSPIMKEAYAEWDRLERASGVKLFTNTGALNIGAPSEIDRVAAVMAANGYKYSKMSNAQLNDRYKGQIDIPMPLEGLLDHGGGTLKADKSLLAMWAQIRANNGVIRDEEHVVSVTGGHPASVYTDKGTYFAQSVAICSGPWAGPMLKKHFGLDLPLRVDLMKVCFWKAKDQKHFGLNFPAMMLHLSERSANFYGVPPPESAGYYKFCSHYGPETDPNLRDVTDSTKIVEDVKKAVGRYLPGLHPSPVVVDTCMYTNTPDSHPIIDVHPTYRNVVFGCGFSGHGFKLAPVVGNILADLATGQRPSHDITPFRCDRFAETSKL